MQAKPEAPLRKPAFGSACNGCGYCCSTQPCQLAEEFLRCSEGPCVALEMRDGRTVCGLVRNPLGYLFKVAHPEAQVPVLDEAPATTEGWSLSVRLAAALGFGQGCDAEDDDESAAWSLSLAEPAAQLRTRTSP